MAGFDKSLDKQLFSKELVFGNSKITVGVYSYNENKPKIQISRETQNAETEEYTFAKLGRLTKEELEKVIPALEEALKHM